MFRAKCRSLVQVADNQRVLLGYLAEEGLIDNLGDWNDLSEDRLFNFLNKLDVTSGLPAKKNQNNGTC